MAAEGMEAVVDFTGVVEVSMVEVSAPELMADTAIPMDTAATLTAMEDATWFGGE
jgi:hypothetical protein